MLTAGFYSHILISNQNTKINLAGKVSHAIICLVINQRDSWMWSFPFFVVQNRG